VRRVEPALAVDDLRASAVLPFEPAATPSPGVSSAFGPATPFGSPAFAERDARDITPPSVPRVPEPIPGRRIAGSLAPAQRFLLRVPERWNGGLVVAGTPGQRTEFACDLLFGDPLLARGYAYIASNKGNGDGAVLLQPGATFAVDGTPVPRFFLPGGIALALWQLAPGHTIEAWSDDFLALTDLAQELIAGLHGQAPDRVYAVGLSNGGYQVRRAIERSDAFAGALTWNAVLWTPRYNVLRYLPAAIAALEAQRPEELLALGIPPDVVGTDGSSLYQRNLLTYYYLTGWLHAMQLDPSTSLAYGDTTDTEPAESWQARIGTWRLEDAPRVVERIAGFANTGAIRCKLIELAAEFDHLVPPLVHEAPYGELVRAAGCAERRRSTVVPFAQHVDAWSELPEFPQMRTAYRQMWAAFDELVEWAG
jgi:hypothetical protein